jgi:hypothetical protein
MLRRVPGLSCEGVSSEPPPRWLARVLGQCGTPPRRRAQAAAATRHRVAKRARLCNAIVSDVTCLGGVMSSSCGRCLAPHISGGAAVGPGFSFTLVGAGADARGPQSAWAGLPRCRTGELSYIKRERDATVLEERGAPWGWGCPSWRRRPTRRLLQSSVPVTTRVRPAWVNRTAASAGSARVGRTPAPLLRKAASSGARVGLSSVRDTREGDRGSSRLRAEARDYKACRVSPQRTHRTRLDFQPGKP